MSLPTLLLSLSLFWLSLHALHAYLRRSAPRPSSARAFSPSLTSAPSWLSRIPWLSRVLGSTQISLRGVKLQVSTQAWNEPHDRLSGWFLKRRNASLREGLRKAYDGGVVLGVIGMVVACGGALWVFYSSALSLLGYWSTPVSNLEPTQAVSGLHRRDALGVHPTETRPSIPIQMIIPGVTVPLSHTPLILTALFLSQLIHELGHALSAALESVPLLSVGASLTLMLPAAHVALSTPMYAALDARKRGRVVGAGPAHNFGMWVGLVLLRRSGLGEAVWWVGWRAVEGGVGVWSVENTSPLAAHLIPGITTITALDDTPMSSTDVWEAHLKAQPGLPEKGWCVPKPDFVAPDICCHPSQTHSSYCFHIHPSPAPRPLGCADPVGIITNTTLVRCRNSLDCKSPWKAPKGNEECVVPDSRDLLRVRIQEGGEKERILVWNGPREEVLEEVRVSTHRPRVRFLVGAQIAAWEAWVWVWSYLEMASLSLYFLNLLPIPYLDGMELFKCVRAWVSERRERRGGREGVEIEER